MEKVMIINGSPRGPKSNSKRYAEIFSKYCRSYTEYYEIRKSNHLLLCREMKHYSDVLFVFPLYADSLPVTLLNFLKTMEENMTHHKPVISVIINCGFIEPQQNDVAVEILKLYCRTNGYPFGSVLEIGSGEAILTTPFRMLVKAKLWKFAASVSNHKYKCFRVTMPISKKMFIRASSVYWENYGKKNGISKEKMATMEIEK